MFHNTSRDSHARLLAKKQATFSPKHLGPLAAPYREPPLHRILCEDPFGHTEREGEIRVLVMVASQMEGWLQIAIHTSYNEAKTRIVGEKAGATADVNVGDAPDLAHRLTGRVRRYSSRGNMLHRTTRYTCRRGHQLEGSSNFANKGGLAAALCCCAQLQAPLGTERGGVGQAPSSFRRSDPKTTTFAPHQGTGRTMERHSRTGPGCRARTSDRT